MASLPQPAPAPVLPHPSYEQIIRMAPSGSLYPNIGRSVTETSATQSSVRSTSCRSNCVSVRSASLSQSRGLTAGHDEIKRRAKIDESLTATKEPKKKAQQQHIMNMQLYHQQKGSQQQEIFLKDEYTGARIIVEKKKPFVRPPPQPTSVSAAAPKDRPDQPLVLVQEGAQTASASTTSDLPSRRSVGWGTITIIEHGRELGDNPACSSGGPPITLGWKPINKTKTFDVELYENARPERRRQEEMMVPPFQREEWLRAEGYSTRQIYDAIREIQRTRSEREETNKNLKFYRIDEFRESSRRKFARLKSKVGKRKCHGQ